MTEIRARDTLALAEHYLLIGQPQGALQTLGRVDAAALEEPAYWRTRAAALLDLDQAAAALDAARSGLRLNADDPWLLSLASRAAEGLGDLAEAERLILAALRLWSENPGWLCQYAVLLARGGDARKAARVQERAEHVAPDDPIVIRTRALLAYLAGDDGGARRHGERLLEHDPEDPAAYAILGATAAVRGDASRAARYFDERARYDVRDHAAAAVAREARIRAHWLFAPLRPFTRFGPGRVWLVAIGVGFLLNAAGLGTLAFGWAVAYIVLVVYSWTVPPLARRYLEWRMG